LKCGDDHPYITRSAPSSRRRRSAPPDVAPVRGHESRHLAQPLQRLPCADKQRRSGRVNTGAAGVPHRIPTVRVRRVAPHTKPTDKTAFPGTRRHGCYYGLTTPDRPLCRQCRAGAVDSSRGPGGYRPSCKRQVSGSNPLTGSTSLSAKRPSHLRKPQHFARSRSCCYMLGYIVSWPPGTIRCCT
jgi:hypothetical protein